MKTAYASVLKILLILAAGAALAGLLVTDYLLRWTDRPYYAAPPPASLHLGPSDVGYSPAAPEFPRAKTNIAPAKLP